MMQASHGYPAVSERVCGDPAQQGDRFPPYSEEQRHRVLANRPKVYSPQL